MVTYVGEVLIGKSYSLIAGWAVILFCEVCRTIFHELQLGPNFDRQLR
jgi:hypothetical protein